MRTKRNFNFVELIVIVASFILLLTILVPACKRSHMASYSNQCSYNLNKIGKVIDTLYQQKHVYPNANTWVEETRRSMVNSLKSYSCPAEDNGVLYPNDDIVVDYAMNAIFTQPLKNSDITNYDNTPILVDAVPGVYIIDFTKDLNGQVSLRHNKYASSSGYKALFMDGSVRYIGMESNQ